MNKTAHQLYGNWRAMINRCYNESHIYYRNYGGRGIAVCDRWLNSFEDFCSDMGGKPSTAYSLDRYPNHDGNYEPGNVRWATRKEQARNKSNNRQVTIAGSQMILVEAAESLGISAFWASELANNEEVRNRVKDKKPYWFPETIQDFKAWCRRDDERHPYGDAAARSCPDHQGS